MKKTILPIAIIITLLLTACLLVKSASALEYQWKFVITEVVDRASAVKVFELLQPVPGVEDIDINILRKSVTVSFDDDLTDEMKLMRRLIKAGYTIEKKEVMMEPSVGVM